MHYFIEFNVQLAGLADVALLTSKTTSSRCELRLNK